MAPSFNTRGLLRYFLAAHLFPALKFVNTPPSSHLVLVFVQVQAQIATQLPSIREHNDDIAAAQHLAVRNSLS